MPVNWFNRTTETGKVVSTYYVATFKAAGLELKTNLEPRKASQPLFNI